MLVWKPFPCMLVETEVCVAILPSCSQSWGPMWLTWYYVMPTILSTKWSFATNRNFSQETDVSPKILYDPWSSKLRTCSYFCQRSKRRREVIPEDTNSTTQWSAAREVPPHLLSPHPSFGCVRVSTLVNIMGHVNRPLWSHNTVSWLRLTSISESWHIRQIPTCQCRVTKYRVLRQVSYVEDNDGNKGWGCWTTMPLHARDTGSWDYFAGIKVSASRRTNMVVLQ